MPAKSPSKRSEATLKELRRKYGELTLEQLSARLDVSAAAVAQFEKRVDHRTSTLREYIEHLGGTLEISAKFGDRRWILKPYERKGETI